jgi:hypothetical protein
LTWTNNQLTWNDNTETRMPHRSSITPVQVQEERAPLPAQRFHARELGSSVGQLVIALALSALLAPSATASSWPAPAASASPAPSRLLLVQAGSTGGTIGKQDKSLSGGEEDERSPRRTAREPNGARGESSRQGNFDGVWSVVSVGETCSQSGTLVAVISNGRITGADGGGGHVSPDGSVRTFYRGEGFTSTATGHLTAHAGSGRFKQSNGCQGRWTAVKK